MKILDRMEEAQGFPESERLLLDKVRDVVREKIAPRAAHYDRHSEFPWENIKDLNALELNKVFLPPAYGGIGISYACYLTIVQTITAGCSSTGNIWATNFHPSVAVLDFGTEEQKQRFLPRIAQGGLGAMAITEEEAGSDATRMTTTFAPDGEDIVLNGSKTFITNGGVSELYLIFGKWSEISDQKKSISALILEKDAPGFIIGNRLEKLGHRASSVVELIFDGCRVPRTNLLREPGDGMRILFSALNKSRPIMASQALGIARSALDDAIDYVNKRRQFGQRIVDFQAIQFMLADMATRLVTTEAFLYYVASLIDSGARDYGVESSMVKLAASDLAMEIATNSLQLFGGHGYTSENRIERLFRDAKVTQIWEGTNQIQRGFIGRSFAKA